jgi:uncharacterized membrane protein
MPGTTTIILRLIHIFAGVFWAGTVFLLARFLLPSFKAAGSAGDKVVQQMFLRKIGVAIPVSALLAVLSGFTMYWRNNSASAGAWAGSRPGMVYGIGGAAALVALILGAAMIGPSLEKSVKLQLAAEAAARALTAEETATIGKMKARAAQMTGIAAVLLVITVAAMAIGRYV